MKFEPKHDRPSILVDRCSGLEFSIYGDRDIKPPFQVFSCLWDGRTVASVTVRYYGLIEGPDGPKLKYVGSLPKLKKYFEIRQPYFTDSEREAIGSFEKCLPIMLAAWRLQIEPPQLIKAGGRVEIDLIDSEDI